MDNVWATLFLGLMIDLTGLAATNFTRKPPEVFYTSSGKDVFLRWDYEVDRNDLKQLAFQWFTFVPPFDLSKPKQIYVETKDGTKQLGGEIPASLQGRVGFEGKATLILRNVSRADNNKYRLLISTASADVPSLTELFVTEPPQPYGKGITPKFQTVNEWQDATFTCRVVGDPSPNVTWKFVTRNKTLTDGEKYRISGTNGNSTLVIRSAGESDNGVYECIASNPVEEVLILNFTLTVPYIRMNEYISTKRVTPSGNAREELTCVAFGWPEPNIEWTNERTKKVVKEKTLRVTASDYGNYTCKASNIAGDKIHKAEVVKDAPVLDKESNRLTFKYEGNATYYTVVGHLKDEEKLVYLGIGNSTVVEFNWCSFDEKLRGGSATINFRVLADGDPRKVVTYVNKTIEKGNSEC